MEMNNTREKLQHLSINDDRKLTLSRKKIKKKKKEEEKIKAAAESEPKFPRCIVSYILSKLPPELLLEKFRFICKLWNEIISTELKPKPSSNIEPQLIVQTEKFRHFTLHLVDMNIDEGELQRSHRKFCDRNGEVLDCCHGVLLLHREGVLHVTNPLTNDDIALPNCPSCTNIYRSCCSLAFDSSANVVKVVHIESAVGFEIFSVGVDQDWRQILGAHDINFSWPDPVCVNGMAMYRSRQNYTHTVSIDVSNEKLRTIILPVSGVRFELLEMGGFLAAMFFISEDNIEIWSLDGFTTEAWTKRHSITTSSIKKDGTFSPCFQLLEPLACFRNSEVILFRKHESRSHYVLYTYDITSCKMKKLKMHTKNRQDFLVYVCSFISWKPSGLGKTISERIEDVSEYTAASRMVNMANRFGALDMDSE